MENFYLIHNGRRLDPNPALGLGLNDYNIRGGDQLHMVLRLRGGMPGNNGQPDEDDDAVMSSGEIQATANSFALVSVSGSAARRKFIHRKRLRRCRCGNG